MSFEENKLLVASAVIFYKNRGYTLRGNINSILKESGFLQTKTTWEDTFKVITEFPESEINETIISATLENFKEDIIKTIHYRDKFLTIYNNPTNYESIYNAIDAVSSSFDDDFSTIFDNSSEFGIIKTIVNDNIIYTTKSIRSLITKVDLGVHALKQDYLNEGYDNVFAYKALELPCFNSIIFNQTDKNIILSADLANQFQDENLRAEIAKLVSMIRDTTRIGHAIEDTGINLFPCINKPYEETEGKIKELAFKTDNGVSHREIARSGIDDVRDGEYHSGGVASAAIEPYDIKKIYSAHNQKLRQDLTLKGTWFVLSLPQPVLTNATISVNSDDDFHSIIKKLINFAT